MLEILSLLFNEINKFLSGDGTVSVEGKINHFFLSLKFETK